jgi:poly-beta-1,6-N-acetyl-D-glucosamine biosynthesis protein PgaD
MKTLIINKRKELPFVKRFIWDMVTILLWVGFVYLWKPLLVVFYKIITLKVYNEDISTMIWNTVESVKFEHAAFMLIATPMILFVLSRLHRHKDSSRHIVYKIGDYANYFNLSDEQLHQSINSQFITVYHNKNGKIINLDNQIKNNEFIK